MTEERVGIMGGSFDPIHLRHVELAACALTEAALSRVIFLPTGNPPHKLTGLENAEDRYEMTRLATLDTPGFQTSRMEIERKGVIYTLDTLLEMRRLLPSAELYYIIGEDTLLELPSWHEPDRVFTLCRFLVIARDTRDPSRLSICGELARRGARLTFLSPPPKDISSTSIRARLKSGLPTPDLAPQVLEYIRVMGLYGVAPPFEHGREMYQKLSAALTDKRLLHSVLVAHTARRLALLSGVDPVKAELAGLLHDCAKCVPLPAMRAIVAREGARVDSLTLQSGNLLHSIAGAITARDEYGIRDEEILGAIRCHTTGRVGMTQLDMVIYLADKIEPSRQPYPGLTALRALSDTSLPSAVMYSLSETMDYVKKGRALVHPETKRVYDWLRTAYHINNAKERIK